MTRPNVIVIMDDEHRGDCLSSAGHPTVKTPHLDALAARGVRFTHAYTPSPVCMPARSCFLSGLFPHNHGQWRNLKFLDPKFDTIAKRLKGLGYRTCHIGKAHLYEYKGEKHLDDMKEDPEENENLAGKDRIQHVETGLRLRLLKWYLQTQIRPEKK